MDNRTRALVIAAVAVLVVLVLLAWRGKKPARGGQRPNPCDSPKMPSLKGVVCSPGDNGNYAWLTTSAPASAGVAVPGGLVPRKTYTATDSDCVTESACQGYCAGDQSCALYVYDSSHQQGTSKCPSTGSVCTTYSGPLPSAVSAGQTAYVSAGIPAGLLPPAKPGGFIPRRSHPVDRCGNFGADPCPYLRYPNA